MGSIFSTYSTGENRVTASIVAVLSKLSLDRIERLLGALLETEIKLVRFDNQIVGGGKSVPHAQIYADCRVLIETKVKRNAVDLEQLKEHLRLLRKGKKHADYLLVITPDEAQPRKIEALDKRRVVWTSFAKLDQAIDELLDDKYSVVSEREAFLLRELQTMLLHEGLIAGESEVVVVAARKAWPEYNEIHAYVCQADRSFQNVSRVGFYSEGVIHPLVPKILASRDNVEIKHGGTDPLGRLVTRIIDEGRAPEGEFRKILLLSAPDSPDTLKLPGPIPNDIRSQSGTGWAFTLSQRYASLERLLKAKTTSDLVDSD